MRGSVLAHSPGKSMEGHTLDEIPTADGTELGNTDKVPAQRESAPNCDSAREAMADSILKGSESVITAALERMVTDDTKEMEQMTRTMQAMEAMVTEKEGNVRALDMVHECAQLRQQLSQALADKDRALAREKVLIEQLRWTSPITPTTPTERPMQVDYRAQAEVFLQRRVSIGPNAQPLRSVID